MAKKSATSNKSAAIREALAANPDKGPKEIAEIVQVQGFKVNAQYVSIIKSNLRKSAGGPGRKVRVKRAGQRLVAAHYLGDGFAPMDAAVQFIQACGGLDQAKQVLAQVEAIRAVV
ncbi:hypothetical protein Pan44_28350 [Caulifigura coniformis]|uniref:Uncharacterized protein n=1 Tax=Caulifigura coniformis TaxID=2527983 RepID=A0A517SFB9_9PLAN|nr:hypothetical protein [Caulifigura coniformis]QDT54797.1 hypothetical protein Pan44_28350 [Caulifigura coniformis]